MKCHYMWTVRILKKIFLCIPRIFLAKAKRLFPPWSDAFILSPKIFRNQAIAPPSKWIPFHGYGSGTRISLKLRRNLNNGLMFLMELLEFLNYCFSGALFKE
uniref:Uncharacterized protein n=1 Tax=Micrurus lemniscatus lemniscatus TaxID=129467 RepID=A0A2D4HLI0_MICLE